MTDYIRQTKANIENKINSDEKLMNESEDEDVHPANFIIDNFKATKNTFNVILAQREIDMQRITSLTVKLEQHNATIDKLTAQQYNIALENANLKIEIDDNKKLAEIEHNKKQLIEIEYKKFKLFFAFVISIYLSIFCACHKFYVYQ